MTNPAKPGWQTSEFYVVILMNLLAVLALLWPDVATKLGSNWVQPLAVMLAGVANVVYPILRTHLKKTLLTTAASPVVTLQSTTSSVAGANVVFGVAAGHPIAPAKTKQATKKKVA